MSTAKQQQSLKDLVVCKYAGCGQIYEEARILPCGNRSCSKHIDAMLIANNGDDEPTTHGRALKCAFCTKEHRLPTAGGGSAFPLDTSIDLLLSMRHSDVHEAAKRKFADALAYVEAMSATNASALHADYFERVAAEIAQEREAVMSKLSGHYDQLLFELDECMQKCTRRDGDEIDAMQRSIGEHAAKLTASSFAFDLRTHNGDEIKWRQIAQASHAVAEQVRSLEHQLKEAVIGRQLVHFEPSKPDEGIDIARMCGRLEHFRAPAHLNSVIVTSAKMRADLLDVCAFADASSCHFKLLYRASRDGFSAASFHARCDAKPKTLLVVRSTLGNVFGGYTQATWDSSSGYKSDPQAFIFSLVNKSVAAKQRALRMPVKSGKPSIHCSAAYGAIFGGGYDLCLNNGQTGYANLGSYYDFPLHAYGTHEARTFLAGAYTFDTSEVELFQLI